MGRESASGRDCGQSDRAKEAARLRQARPPGYRGRPHCPAAQGLYHSDWQAPVPPSRIIARNQTSLSASRPSFHDVPLCAFDELAVTDRERAADRRITRLQQTSGFGNVFRRIRAPVGQLAGPAVLFWPNAMDTVVERNQFIECDRGIALGLSAPDPRMARDGETTYDHQRGTVRNNMIYRSAGAPTADIGISVNYARDFRILHNTVIQHGTFAYGAIEYRFPVSRGVIRGNLTDGPIWQRDGAMALLALNVVDASSAWFVDDRYGDLHLIPSASRAIDAAPVRQDVADDFDGDARPQGAAADIGADELVPAEPSPSFTAAATATITATRPPSGTPATATATVPSPPPGTPEATHRLCLPLVLLGTTDEPPSPPGGTVRATVGATATAAVSATASTTPSAAR